jgi:hypothetical protein
MIFYKNNYAIEKTLTLKPGLEQKFLLEYTGKHFPAREAEKIWLKVIDHKWFISEQLNRDIGLKVAAIDYVQNFYEPKNNNNKNNFSRFLLKFFRTAFYSVSPPPVSKKYNY